MDKGELTVTVFSAESGPMLSLLMMAIALGMDAFSLGIGMGMRNIRFIQILKISFVIGIFHVIMPLLGMFAGKYVSSFLDDIAEVAGGGLLILLGIHMIYSAWRGGDDHVFNAATFWGLMMFALSVSLDSFSVGISLGLFASHIWLTVIMFGFFGAVMSFLGLTLGSKISSSLGGYGEALGGMVLVLFGLKVML